MLARSLPVLYHFSTSPLCTAKVYNKGKERKVEFCHYLSISSLSFLVSVTIGGVTVPIDGGVTKRRDLIPRIEGRGERGIWKSILDSQECNFSSSIFAIYIFVY